MSTEEISMPQGESCELIAKTFMGLEPVLARELTAIGAMDVTPGRRMVSFRGDKAMMYRANIQLRTAIRVLKPISHFRARSADEVYAEVKKTMWSDYLTVGQTFAVDAIVFSEEFKHSKFVSYKVKDAIVDWFREHTGTRPNISVTSPDIRLNMHISEDDCTLSLDSSGESLHRRGYRQESVDAPLNEVLAAGMIAMTGWDGSTDFIDPMCGSGTLLIEAALIARNIAPGLWRKSYAFERWQDYDADLFQTIYNDDSAERAFTHHIYGYDNDPKAVLAARKNIRAAGLSDMITVTQADFKDFTQPAEKSIIVTNPPYGERMSPPDLLGTYRMIGERLKHQFVGGEAWILSYREECFDEISLKPSLKVPLYNGSLECEFRKYQIFDGKMKDFCNEGGSVKTDEERRMMSEKHRFKREREFKRRLSAETDEENAEGDIRSFKFNHVRINNDDDDADMFRRRPKRDGYEHFDRSGRERQYGRGYGGRDRDRNSRNRKDYGGRGYDRDNSGRDSYDRRGNNHDNYNRDNYGRKSYGRDSDDRRSNDRGDRGDARRGYDRDRGYDRGVRDKYARSKYPSRRDEGNARHYGNGDNNTDNNIDDRDE